MAYTVDEYLGKADYELDNGNTRQALEYFDAAINAGGDTAAIMLRGYVICMAVEKQEFDEAVNFCLRGMEAEPGNSVHYYNLGKIYVLTGRKKEAIKVFRDGLLFKKNPRIIEELNKLGQRDLPVIHSLGRDHVFNRFLGWLGHGLGVRR